MTKKAPEKAKMILKKDVWKISVKLIIENPLNIKLSKIETGITNPIIIGIKQIKKQTIFWSFEEDFDSTIFCPLLFSWYLCLLLARYSIVSSTTTKTKSTEEICEAPDKLFIPSQTLNTPRVNVSKAKYSTVPKSEIVSINTKATPAIIPGRANGSATLKKLLLP